MTLEALQAQCSLLLPAYNAYTDTVANRALAMQKKSFSFFFFVVFSFIFMRRHDMKTKFRSNASLRLKFIAKENSSACNCCAGSKSMNLGAGKAICLYALDVVDKAVESFSSWKSKVTQCWRWSSHKWVSRKCSARWSRNRRRALARFCFCNG